MAAGDGFTAISFLKHLLNEAQLFVKVREMKLCTRLLADFSKI